MSGGFVFAQSKTGGGDFLDNLPFKVVLEMGVHRGITGYEQEGNFDEIDGDYASFNYFALGEYYFKSWLSVSAGLGMKYELLHVSAHLYSINNGGNNFYERVSHTDLAVSVPISVHFSVLSWAYLGLGLDFTFPFMFVREDNHHRDDRVNEDDYYKGEHNSYLKGYIDIGFDFARKKGQGLRFILRNGLPGITNFGSNGKQPPKEWQDVFPSGYFLGFVFQFVL
jgi:hypothetical protein